MKIAIGADHAGFELKEHLRERLAQAGHTVVDVGTNSPESSDYPDFAIPVARMVAAGTVDRGILVCSTGVGMAIAANKIPGVRAAVGTGIEEVQLTRSHNDANVLTLGAKYITPAQADAMVDVFLSTGFLGGRHARRIGKIAAMERETNSEKETDETK
jgi:ribose 5-phosphate isomerase B